MSALRRAGWFVLLGLWPAVIAVKVFWHPSWAGGLSDAGAAASLALGVTLMRTGEPVPRLRDWALKRRVSEIARRQAATEVRQQAQQARLDGLTDGLLRTFAAAGKDAPEAMGADAPTIPHLHRVV
jgi:hypothetical protein